MTSAAGHDAPLSFNLESSFADGSTANPQPFGLDATLSTAEGQNNVTRMYEPLSRDPSTTKALNFSGSFSVEFTLTNPFWIPAVIAGSAGSYSGETPETMTILSGTGQYKRAFLGCAVSSMTISVSDDEPATVTLDGDYADEDTVSVTQPSVAHNPMVDHDAQLTLGGTTRNLVQEVEFSIENNTDIPSEIGTRFGVDYSPKQREATVSYTEYVNSGDNVSNFYGGTTPTTDIPENDAVLAFENGAGETITFTAANAKTDTFGNNGAGDPEADLEESVELVPSTISATASGYFAV